MEFPIRGMENSRNFIFGGLVKPFFIRLYWPPHRNIKRYVNSIPRRGFHFFPIFAQILNLKSLNIQ